MKRFSFILIAALVWMSSIAVSPTQITYAAETPGPTHDYVVKAGDTLLGIALEFDISMAAIQLINDLVDPRLIKVGQTLKIPNEKLQPDENVFWVLHIVQAGETLGEIAAQHEVKLSDLTRVNDIANASAIRIGQKLVVPVAGPASQAQGVPSAPTQSDEQKTELHASVPAPTPTPELIPLVPVVPVATQEPPTQAELATSALEAAATPIALPTLSVSDVPAEPAAGVDVIIETARARLLELYNQARIAGGLPPLAYSFTLQASAQEHAQDCTAHGSCSHIGSDGSKSSQRIARVGYAGRITGENWAWARTADKSFDMWFNQEPPDGPHRANIMSPRFTEVGFGIAASKGGYYMIANFGAP